MTATAATDQIDPRLAEWERKTQPIIVLAAIVPIAVAFTPEAATDPFTGIDILSWLVFLVDLIVHIHYQRRYLRTGIGKFDLGIVVLTFPWYLLPGIPGGGVLGLARLGRLARLVMAGSSTGLMRRIAARIGKAGLYSLALIVVCSEVVYRVEPASAGYATRGDAIWWGFVTFTTVGYGDYVPTTAPGRVVAVALMIGGIALIGLLAGSLAEFLTETPTDDEDVDSSAAPEASDVDPVLAELQAVRAELVALRASLGDRRDP